MLWIPLSPKLSELVQMLHPTCAMWMLTVTLMNRLGSTSQLKACVPDTLPKIWLLLTETSISLLQTIDITGVWPEMTTMTMSKNLTPSVPGHFP